MVCEVIDFDFTEDWTCYDVGNLGLFISIYKRHLQGIHSVHLIKKVGCSECLLIIQLNITNTFRLTGRSVIDHDVVDHLSKSCTSWQTSGKQLLIDYVGAKRL